jgi:hypothetical protein
VWRASVLILMAAVALQADLATVKAEPNLERRSQFALQHAEEEIAAAKKSYDAGSLDDFKRLVGEIGDLAELSYDSLEDTGKRARRDPKWFKRAEQKLLGIMRKIDSLEKDVSIDDRDVVKHLRKRVSDVHDRLLNDIMTKK